MKTKEKMFSWRHEELWVNCLGGMLFSSTAILGKQLASQGKIDFGNIKMYIAILFFGLFLAFLLHAAWRGLDWFNAKTPKKISDNLLSRVFQRKATWLLCFCLLLLCWLPVFFAAYPGFFCYDAKMQWTQFANHAITAHHPPLHTVLLGGIIQLVYRLSGNFNTGVAVYLLLQMTCLSACFTYTISRMHKWGVATPLLVLTAAFYAFFPIIVMFAMCSTKDTLFCAVTLLFLVMLVDALKNTTAFFSSAFLVARFAIASFFMCLLRNNAIYAFAVFVFFCILLIKQHRVKFSVLFSAVILATLLCNGFVYTALGVAPGNKREMLCVPMQQLARVYAEKQDKMNSLEKEKFLQYIREKGLNNYNPKWADLVKNNFNMGAVEENPLAFLKFWFETGVQNPGIYLNSFLMNTYQSWYPFCLVDGYNTGGANGLYPQGKTSVFEYRTEAPAEASSKLPWLYEQYRFFAKDMKNEPILPLFFSLGVMHWLLLLALLYAWHKKHKIAILSFIYLLLLSLTVFLGPIMLIRYFLQLFFALPLLVSFFFHRPASSKDVVNIL